MLFSYPLSAFDPEDDLVDVIDLKIEMISLKHPISQDITLGYGFPVSFEFPPLLSKPSSACLASEFV